MATWAEMIDEIYVLTSRDDLVAETAIALRGAVRLAHKSAKYWRDLKEVVVTLPVTQVQELELPDWAPKFRAVASLISYTDRTKELESIQVDDLLDLDGYSRTNVYWGLGTKLRLRAANPETNYLLSYFAYPVVTPVASFNSWIAEEHNDLLVLLAASTILGTVGEQEIKSRIDALAAAELSALRNSNIEISGR